MPKFNGLKWIFLGLLAAAFLCFVMGGVTVRQEIARFGRKPQFPPTDWRPSPFARVAPQTTANVYPQAKPPELPLPQKQSAPLQRPPVELLGRWEGTGATATGFFSIMIEITPDTRNPAQLLAYSQMIVIALPTAPGLGKRQPNVRELLEQRFPRRLSLVGTPSDDGAVVFHVSQAIGPQGDCPITDIRVSPWGTEGIAAEWKGAACPGGSLVLVRAR